MKREVGSTNVSQPGWQNGVALIGVRRHRCRQLAEFNRRSVSYN